MHACSSRLQPSAVVAAGAAAQVAALERRPHIVIATPGRLLDLADDKAVDLSACLRSIVNVCYEACCMVCTYEVGCAPQLWAQRCVCQGLHVLMGASHYAAACD